MAFQKNTLPTAKLGGEFGHSNCDYQHCSPTKGAEGVLPSTSKPFLFVVVTGHFDHCILPRSSPILEGGFLRADQQCLHSRALLSAKLHPPSHQMGFLHYILLLL